MKSASPLVYLGIGAAIATGALFLMSQAVPPTSPYSGAYPARKNVVNIFDRPTNPTTIAIGQDFVVYTVPSDRWLTVTACDAGISPVGSCLWGELNGGSFIPKGHAVSGTGIGNSFANMDVVAHSPQTSQVGWVFAPGSQLVLRNLNFSSTAYMVQYSVTGYLSRE